METKWVYEVFGIPNDAFINFIQLHSASCILKAPSNETVDVSTLGGKISKLTGRFVPPEVTIFDHQVNDLFILAFNEIIALKVYEENFYEY